MDFNSVFKISLLKFILVQKLDPKYAYFANKEWHVHRIGRKSHRNSDGVFHSQVLGNQDVKISVKVKVTCNIKVTSMFYLKGKTICETHNTYQNSSVMCNTILILLL